MEYLTNLQSAIIFPSLPSKTVTPLIFCKQVLSNKTTLAATNSKQRTIKFKNH